MVKPCYLDQWRSDALDRTRQPWQKEMAHVIQSVANRGGQVRESALAQRYSPSTVEKLVRRKLLRRHWYNGAECVAAQLNRAEWE